MTEPIEQAFVTPRYLAGGVDPAWVTVPLHRACGWSSADDPLMPRVILTSPDQLAQLRIDPTPDPGEPWWSIRHARVADERPWSITFDAQTPVEIIAAVTDALTDPSAPPPESGDLFAPLRAAGWQVPRHHEEGTVTEVLAAPDGLARVERLHHEGRTVGWNVETSVPHLPTLWRAYLDGSTPAPLVSALFRALADPDPIMRAPQRLPYLATARGTNSRRPVSAETLAFALEHRTTALTQRRTPPAPEATPARPPVSQPRRTR
ncbi:DUF317 domain-containing protein [Streptomyces himalayensis]|uniref:DUF317 domain-containing protein n=1 Tax=Streptomyces himalayensis TaxID=2820085 RepID=UPI001C66A365|nr:DUF317 domain-containing protein [Streptomyces himalayensis]